jgi:hypothetical protein
VHLFDTVFECRTRFVEAGFLKHVERLFNALLSNLDGDQHSYNVYPIIERLSVVSQEAKDALTRCNALIKAKLGSSEVAKIQKREAESRLREYGGRPAKTIGLRDPVIQYQDR